MGRASRARRQALGPSAVQPVAMPRRETPPERLTRLADLARQAESDLWAEIARARAQGLTFDQIAQATGLNRETIRRKAPRG